MLDSLEIVAAALYPNFEKSYTRLLKEKSEISLNKFILNYDIITDSDTVPTKSYYVLHISD